MKQFLAGYVAGVVSVPIVVYVFREDLGKKAAPFVMNALIDEENDQKIFEFMSQRLDLQDFRKEKGKEIHQLKAQGYSVKEIAEKMGHSEAAIKTILLDKPDELK